MSWIRGTAHLHRKSKEKKELDPKANLLHGFHLKMIKQDDKWTRSGRMISFTFFSCFTNCRSDFFVRVLWSTLKYTFGLFPCCYKSSHSFFIYPNKEHRTQLLYCWMCNQVHDWHVSPQNLSRSEPWIPYVPHSAPP